MAARASQLQSSKRWYLWQLQLAVTCHGDYRRVSGTGTYETSMSKQLLFRICEWTQKELPPGCSMFLPWYIAFPWEQEGWSRHLGSKEQAGVPWTSGHSPQLYLSDLLQEPKTWWLPHTGWFEVRGCQPPTRVDGQGTISVYNISVNQQFA